MPLLLTRKDVESVLTMSEAIEAVEEGLRQLALGTVTMPQRTAIRMEKPHGLHLGMPACIGGEHPVLALKVVTVFPENPSKHGLPTTIGTLLLNNPQTGSLLAIMDAGYLTGVRTGAISGVATKHLARRDASSVGIFGAGGMARHQLAAVCEVRRIESAVVYDTVPETARRFAAEMAPRLGIGIEVAAGPAACLDADIVVAITSSREPLFAGRHLQPGTHVNGAGAHSPDARELDAETLSRSTVVVDHRPACLAEAGELILAIQDGAFSENRIHASLGEVVAGMKPGRTREDEITVFKSVGLAVQDAATAALVYARAIERGIGTEITI